MSWWYKLVRRDQPRDSSEEVQRRPRSNLELGYDHFMNRLEKESNNATRMGLQLAIFGAPFSSNYTLYTTTSINGEQVTLYNEQGNIVLPRSYLFWNGPYLWISKL